MRRLWAAGAAMLVCSSLVAIPVLAQEATEPSVSPLVSPAPAPENAYVTGLEICRGSSCREQLSDPRVSGELGLVYQERCYVGEPSALDRSGCVSWGFATIYGPDGRWRGPWAGLWDDGLHKDAFLVIFEGTDAYEGWTFVAHYLELGGGDSKVNGVIYQGPPPPMDTP